jgi:hypothetical protein
VIRREVTKRLGTEAIKTSGLGNYTRVWNACRKNKSPISNSTLQKYRFYFHCIIFALSGST